MLQVPAGQRALGRAKQTEQARDGWQGRASEVQEIQGRKGLRTWCPWGREWVGERAKQVRKVHLICLEADLTPHGHLQRHWILVD